MTSLRFKATLASIVVLVGLGVLLGHRAAQVTCQISFAFSIACVFVGIRRNKPNRSDPWVGFALAATAFFCSYGLRMIFPGLNAEPGSNATAADVVDTFGYLAALFSGLRLGQVRDRDRDPTTIIDAVIVTGGISAIIWIALMIPVIQDSTLNHGTKWLAVYSVALAIGLIFAAVRLGLGPGVKNTASRLLGGVAISSLLAQVSYSAGLENSDRYILFFASITAVFLAAAALHPSMVDMTRPISRGVAHITKARMVIMAIALLIAPTMLVVRTSRESDDIVYFAGLIVSWIVVTTLVMIRFAGLVIARERVATSEQRRSTTVASLVASLDIESTYKTVTIAVTELAGEVEQLRVSVALKEDDEWFVKSSSGFRSEAALGRRLDGELMTAMTTSDESFQLEDTITFDAPSVGKSAFLLVPLVSKSTVRGAIMVSSAAPLKPPAVASISSIATDIALAIEAMRLAEGMHRERSEQRFRALVEHSADVIVVFVGGVVDFMSPTAERLLGDDSRSLEAVLQLVDEQCRPELKLRIETANSVGHNDRPFEFSISEAEEARWFEATASDLTSMDEVRGVVLNAREITERRAVEAERDLRDARFRSLVQNSSDLTIVLDARAALSYVSPSVMTLLHYNEDELLGTEFSQLVHPNDQDVLNTLASLLLSGSTSTRKIELRVRAADKEFKTLDVTLTNLLEDAAVQGIVINAHDVTDRKQLEHDLRERVLHDDLTGLANRVLFRERVDHALRSRSGTDHVAAVLYLDIDDFKDINDGLGQKAGDDILRTVAFRLEQFVRAGDTSARLSADEFAVLLEDVYTVQDVTHASERLLEVMREPVLFEDREVDLRISVGVALAGQFDNAEVVLRNADVALYHAKQSGKGRVRFFDEAMHEAAFERLELRGDLQRALERDQLSMHYQPLISFETGATIGFEALMRWTHPVRGFVSPAVFIPLAEESGLIVPLGKWALQTALAQLKVWQDNGATELGMSINVSPRQLEEANVVSELSSVIELAGVNARTVTLELTESIGLDDSISRERLASLRELGCEIAADDFGTGFASYAALQQLPFTNVKIDRSLIIGLSADDDRARAQVKSIVQMGHALGFTITAEGIEDAAQAAALKEIGADKGQGYFFGRPVPAAENAEVVSRVLPVG